MKSSFTSKAAIVLIASVSVLGVSDVAALAAPTADSSAKPTAQTKLGADPMPSIPATVQANAAGLSFRGTGYTPSGNGTLKIFNASNQMVANLSGSADSSGTITFTGAPALAVGEYHAYATDFSSSTVSTYVYFKAVAAPVFPDSDGTVPAGKVSQVINHAIATGADTCTLSSGYLPDGVSLNGCQLVGTPTKAATYNFTITAASGTVSVQKAFTWVIAANDTPAPAPTFPFNGVVPSVAVNTPFNKEIAFGATNCEVIAGSLPAGVQLTNCALVGTPTVAGQYAFTIRATTTSGETADQAFTWDITAVPAPTPTPTGSVTPAPMPTGSAAGAAGAPTGAATGAADASGGVAAGASTGGSSASGGTSTSTTGGLAYTGASDAAKLVLAAGGVAITAGAGTIMVSRKRKNQS